jgi:hypothetical protein
MRFARAAKAGWAALALLALAGCGEGARMGDVSGAVTFDGKPVEDGAITFVPADGKSPTAGGAIKDGRYAVRVPLGEAKVVINGKKVIGKKKIYNTPDSPEMPVTAELLPEKYSDMSKTELRFDVAAGANPKDWELRP